MTYASAVVATFALGVMPAGIRLLPVAPSPSVGGTTYYLSATGNDANTGITPTSPWQTLSRADLVQYHAGDRLLLEGGATFAGSLVFTSTDRGTSRRPIAVGTYGTGRATIEVSDDAGSGILVDGSAGIAVSNLNLVGPGRTVSTKPGVFFYTRGASVLNFVSLRNITVTDFNQGVAFGVKGSKAGFQDIRMTSVNASNNADVGIETFGNHVGSLQNVSIVDSVTTGNTGVPGKGPNTGSGILLGDVANAVVYHCVASHNGALDDATALRGATKGPVGIWAYDSTKLRFLNNESYDNATGNHSDGDGFDLDVGVTESTMEYNYSYGNAGAGFLLDGTGTSPNLMNTVRYNISDYNGWDNSYGGLELYGSVRGAELYDNTVYVGSFPTSEPQAIQVRAGASDDSFRNNLLVTLAPLPLIKLYGAPHDLHFQENDYWSSARFLIDWGHDTYQSLRTWRSKTGEERSDGLSTGLNVDPEVMDSDGDGVVGTASQITGLRAFKLRARSPLRDAGLDLTRAPFDLTIGSSDFWGDPLEPSRYFSIGADQFPKGR
jgi:hypothetical protein